MRVITGKAKGHKLNAPSGTKTRPTTDKVKESIFNIIGYIHEDAVVLDLFAGSGAMGIEFLSRGAKECIFIDADRNAVNVIKENLKKTRLMDQSKVFKTDVKKAIAKLKEKAMKFDFVFMDPPYGREFVEATLEQLLDADVLSEDVLIVVEHSNEEQLEECIGKLRVTDSRKYGISYVTFLEMKEEI